MVKSLIFLLIFNIFLSSQPVQSMEEEEDAWRSQNSSIRSEDSLDELSDYSEETIEKANAAFLHGEEEERDKLEKPLTYATRKNYKYCLSQYANWFLSKDKLLNSQDIISDIRKACNCLLKAAYREEQFATNYVAQLEPLAKKINKKNQEEIGIMDLLKKEERKARRTWLKSDGLDYNQVPSPSHIKDALDLLFLCIITELDDKVFDQFNKQLYEKINALTKHKNSELKGRNAVGIDRYVTEKLHLKTSSAKDDYSGKSQSELKDGEYAFFDTCHKYPYCLDIGVRVWNHGTGSKFLKDDKGGRFVKTDPVPMAAGPVYKNLRKKKPSSTNINLSDSTSFLIKNFYEFSTKFFHESPLWVVEITHIEDPWQKIDQEIKDKYDGKWPNLKSEKTKENDAELDKEKKVKKLFKEEISKFVQEEKAKKSVSYRLFMLSVIENIRKESNTQGTCTKSTQ